MLDYLHMADSDEEKVFYPARAIVRIARRNIYSHVFPRWLASRETFDQAITILHDITIFIYRGASLIPPGIARTEPVKIVYELP